MEKVALRKSIIAHLKHQDRKEKALKDKALLDDLLASSAYQKANTIATYLAFDFEYNTELLIKQAQKDGKTILVPKTYPHGKMIFCLLTSAIPVMRYPIILVISSSTQILTSSDSL